MQRATPSLRAGEHGYTLIELLVMLTVISLLIAATPAIVSAARPGAEVRVATYAFADVLRTARTAAIMTDADRFVLIDLENGTYVASDGKTHELPDHVAWKFEGPLAPRTGAPVELRFFPDGSSSGARIRISGAEQDRLIVNHGLTGRISVDE